MSKSDFIQLTTEQDRLERLIKNGFGTDRMRARMEFLNRELKCAPWRLDDEKGVVKAVA